MISDAKRLGTGMKYGTGMQLGRGMKSGTGNEVRYRNRNDYLEMGEMK